MQERSSLADACCSVELNTYESSGAQDGTANCNQHPDNLAHIVAHDVLDVDRRIRIRHYPYPCWIDTSDSHHASQDRRSMSQDRRADFEHAW